MTYDRFGGSLRLDLITSQAVSMEHRWLDALGRRISIAKAERDAIHAGRIVQINLLVAALDNVCPGHGVLQPSGLTYANGDPAFPWQRPFEDAFDRIAIVNAIPQTVGPQSPKIRM